MGKNVKHIRRAPCAKCGKEAHRISYRDEGSRIEHYTAAEGKACKALPVAKKRAWPKAETR